MRQMQQLDSLVPFLVCKDQKSIQTQSFSTFCKGLGLASAQSNKSVLVCAIVRTNTPVIQIFVRIVRPLVKMNMLKS